LPEPGLDDAGTACSSTMPRDHLHIRATKLPAIGGLTQEIHSQTGFTYRAGTWEEDAHLGLL
jgi:hypothetical protein